MFLFRTGIDIEWIMKLFRVLHAFLSNKNLALHFRSKVFSGHFPTLKGDPIINFDDILY